MLSYTKTVMTITLKLGIRILYQNNKENVDFTEIKVTFSLSVTFGRPF